MPFAFSRSNSACTSWLKHEERIGVESRWLTPLARTKLKFELKRTNHFVIGLTPERPHSQET